MPNIGENPLRLLAIFVVVLAPVGTMAAIATASQHDEAQLCEIKATSGLTTVRLDALIHAGKHVGGTYAFHVEKSGKAGTSTINQGGDFDATAGGLATLSSVSFETKGASYKATLDVIISGKRYSCTKQIDGD